MIDTKNIQELLKRELTRKEFLQVTGLMLLSIVGISGILKNMNNSLSPQAKKSDDYGESSYGG